MKLAAQLMGVVLAFALVYDGWIFYSRWSARRQTQLASAAQEIEEARRNLQLAGGGALKINSFYPSPGIVPKGSPVNICYGVVGAKKVQIEPPVAEVWPSLARCLQVTPTRNTEYKLTATDAAGHTVSESFALRVR